MSFIKQYRKKSKDEVKALLSSAPQTIERIEETITSLFAQTNTTTLQEEYAKALVPNPERPASTLQDAIQAYNLTLADTISLIQTIERFITLNIPQMEDGNNFGVTVQMTVSKALQEVKDTLTKRTEAVSSYYSTRADLVDKFGLVKETNSITVTESASKSTSEGGEKSGDEKKQSSTEVKESKKSGNNADFEGRLYPRLLALVAADVNCYMNARTGLVDCRNSLLMIYDNVEKNFEKLASPKGGGGNSMGMY